MDTQDLCSLVYVSSAVHTFDAHELSALLEKSRSNNVQLGITGMLLYKDGNFIQAVEGPPENVARLERSIAADQRHKDVTVLLRTSLIARSFPDWSMGFRDLTKVDTADLPGFSTLLNARSIPEAFKSAPSKAHKLLLAFKTNM